MSLLLLLLCKEGNGEASTVSFLPHQVNPVLKKCLEEQGLKFVGQDVEGERMEILELEGDWVVITPRSVGK